MTILAFKQLLFVEKLESKVKTSNSTFRLEKTLDLSCLRIFAVFAFSSKSGCRDTAPRALSSQTKTPDCTFCFTPCSLIELALRATQHCVLEHSCVSEVQSPKKVEAALLCGPSVRRFVAGSFA